MRDADRAAGRCDRDRRAGSSGAGAAVPHCPALGQRHCARLRGRQQPAGIFPADAGRAGHRRGRADGRGRDLLFRQAELELDVPRGVLVTMQDVDTRVREMGRLVGYSCDLALHRGLSLGEIPAFCHKRSNYRYVNCIMSPPEQIAANRRVLITMWKCGKAIGVQSFHTVNRVVNTRIL